jgi:hypothetical protein
LSILRSLKDVSTFEKVFLWLARSSASKSVGVKALESICECVEMGQSIDTILRVLEVTPMDKHLGQIQKWRYPMSTERDDKKKADWLALPWPAHSQIQWQRQGDEAGVEVKLFISSAKSLKNYILGLENTLKTIEKNNAEPK